ncbi:MAG: zinc metallopeptidase [Firmicutes bacterium]|nr:zinc metallopeptidase [Bacillota bacterium]
MFENFIYWWGEQYWETQMFLIVTISFLPLMILGFVMQARVRSVFQKYSGVATKLGTPAHMVARFMLDEYGLQRVQVRHVGGNLTDHYDPRSDSVALSETVYHSSSIAAIGVACHEAGHAIQQDRGHVFSRIRNTLVPVVNFTNRTLMPLLIIGMILAFMGMGWSIFFIWIGLAVFGVGTIFSLINLPVEFDASRRALQAIKKGNFTQEELVGARKVLTAAALTYVVAFLISLTQFLRFLSIFFMRRR